MKSRLLLTFALTLSIVCGTAHAQSQSQQAQQSQNSGDVTYFQDWCTRVVDRLQHAMQVAQTAGTDFEEQQILLGAIDIALNTANERHRRYFNYTLSDAKANLSFYENDLLRQNYFLKQSIQEAIQDLYYVDRTSRNPNDATQYSATVLERSLEWGARAVTNTTELGILRDGIERALDFLDGSDYRRLPHNACAAKTLSNALDTANNSSLQAKTKIFLLRDAASSARQSIQHGCRE